MHALDLILFVAGAVASLVVATGCVVCFVVWLAGNDGGRATEVCPRVEKS
ncbi:MAG TPA: hypothetical protein VHN79_02800 [Lacunisphaera sp.]|nr:hypothetical protein [Lacunisphaera sp.]